MAMTEEEAREMVAQAEAAYEAGDWARAGELFSTLLIEPEAVAGSRELHWNYAMCLANQGNWPLALEHVQASGYSVEEFRETCRQAGLRDAEHDLEEATRLFQNGQWDEAADAFTELLLHPSVPASAMRDIHWNIALCLARGGDFPTALQHVRVSGYSEADFREACHQANIDLARHEYAHAVALYDQGQWSQAADAFAELLISPGVGAESMDELQWNLAMCFANMGNWDTAFGHIRAAGWSEQEFREAVIAGGLQPPAAE